MRLCSLHVFLETHSDLGKLLEVGRTMQKYPPLCSHAYFLQQVCTVTHPPLKPDPRSTFMVPSKEEHQCWSSAVWTSVGTDQQSSNKDWQEVAFLGEVVPRGTPSLLSMSATPPTPASRNNPSSIGPNSWLGPSTFQSKACPSLNDTLFHWCT